MWTRKSRVLAIACLGASTVLAASCAGPVAPRLDIPRAEFENPRFLGLEIVIAGEVAGVLEGEELRAHNESLGIPADTPRQLLIWSAEPMDNGWQIVQREGMEPRPVSTTVDPDHGNVIHHWDFSEAAERGYTFEIRRRYALVLHDGHVPLDDPGFGVYTKEESDLVVFYTREEPFHELTPEIRAAARTAVGELTDPADKARALFREVRERMTYVYPPPDGRGALKAFQSGVGDCGQYADLFIAFCRAEGVPARFVGGLHLKPKDDEPHGRAGSHAWAEVFLPGGMWVPVDPTGSEEEFFAALTGRRNLACSVGRNIPLPGAPEWARYTFSEVESGRADLMQTFTTHLNGVRVVWRVSRNTVDHN